MHDPVKVLKEKEMYYLLNSLVNNNIISGKLYRGTDWEYQKLEKGDIIDYSDRLSSWSMDKSVAENFTTDENPIILKLKCKNVPGIPIFYSRREKEIILSECTLKVTEKKIHDGTIYLIMSVV